MDELKAALEEELHVYSSRRDLSTVLARFRIDCANSEEGRRNPYNSFQSVIRYCPKSVKFDVADAHKGGIACRFLDLVDRLPIPEELNQEFDDIRRDLKRWIHTRKVEEMIQWYSQSGGVTLHAIEARRRRVGWGDEETETMKYQLQSKALQLVWEYNGCIRAVRQAYGRTLLTDSLHLTSGMSAAK
ncbi:hypothetical protein VPNG_10020 [Cytospora leucostoma]|uniref:Uncharacterized protein n=1 Tax=Cytospora leucostoma TaxID=1230097 RepID=A0A423VHL2_9PEZI|nr:hypothetical protein VPNG_10020 [Cytospora leucostoma]